MNWVHNFKKRFREGCTAIKINCNWFLKICQLSCFSFIARRAYLPAHRQGGYSWTTRQVTSCAICKSMCNLSLGVLISNYTVLSLGQCEQQLSFNSCLQSSDVIYKSRGSGISMVWATEQWSPAPIASSPETSPQIRVHGMLHVSPIQ